VSSEASKSSGNSFLTRLAELSAQFAGISAVVYVIGLLSLLMPISADTGSSVAWYAVALVPRTVVAGHGLRLMVLSVALILFVVLTFVPLGIALVLGYFAYEWRPWNLRKRWYQWIVWLLILLPAALLAFSLYLGFGPRFTLYLANHMVAGFFGPQALSDTSKLHIIDYLVMVLGGIGGFLALAKMAVSVRHFDWRGLFVGFMIFFISTSSLAITQIADSPPSLPRVEVSGPDRARSTKGLLLSHSEGFWYVLNSGKDVVAIPDGKVDKVRLHTP
jgi:hypothetical protein